MRDAMLGHIELLRKRGEEVPVPSAVSATTVDAA